jgi:hypothetical protein
VRRRAADSLAAVLHLRLRFTFFYPKHSSLCSFLTEKLPKLVFRKIGLKLVCGELIANHPYPKIFVQESNQVLAIWRTTERTDATSEPRPKAALGAGRR